jgi:hypothetical protein
MMAWVVRSPLVSISSGISFYPEMNERSFLFYNFSPICQEAARLSALADTFRSAHPEDIPAGLTKKNLDCDNQWNSMIAAR